MSSSTAGLVEGTVPRIFGAQASGCAPIVRLVERGDDEIVPEQPRTIARSIAIGNPADGRAAARIIRETGGWASHVSDDAIVAGIHALAEDSGVFAETAGGTTVAAALALARTGRLRPDDELVLCITGHGLKTLEALGDVAARAPVIDPRLRDVAALAAAAAGESAR